MVSRASDKPEHDAGSRARPEWLDALRRAGRTLRRAVAGVAGVAPDEDAERRVHELRIATRRVGALLVLLAGALPPEPVERLAKTLRRLRRAAGRARDADVRKGMLSELRQQVRDSRRSAVDGLLGVIEEERRENLSRIVEVARRLDGGALRKRARAVEVRVKRESKDAVGAGLRRVEERLRLAGEADANDPEALHELRLAIKQARYALEHAKGLGASAGVGLGQTLAGLQHELGLVTDAEMLVAWLREREAASPQDGALRSIRRGFESVEGARRQRAIAAWEAQESAVLAALGKVRADESVVREESEPSASAKRRMMNGSVMQGEQGTGLIEAKGVEGPTPGSEAAEALGLRGLRIGVVDVGSASVRLLVVEMHGTREWRTLAEEREQTRLGSGLAEKGAIEASALARSVDAVAKLATMARELGASRLGVFATAAVREAENGREFLEAVKARTGLVVEVVSDAEEGRLAFRSAARSFDLSGGRSAVMDLGGGSLEVVQGVGGRDEAIVFSNVSLPLGAVRVTHRFDDAGDSAERFKEMRDHVRTVVRAAIAEPDEAPAVVVGCGGTFTTILAMAAGLAGVEVEKARGVGPALAAFNPVPLLTIESLQRLVRKTPPTERRGIVGLPEDRVDIILAGLTAVREAMERLGAAAVHVHPGGLREGLVLEMVRREVAGVRVGASLAARARQFAERCRYPKAHSEQVASLAVRLLGGLIERGIVEKEKHLAGMEEREAAVLLEAAAVLHDVGCLVQYKRHHRHSYQIVMNAELGGDEREKRLVATIARYHRKAAPSPDHAEFAALDEGDRVRVRTLAGVLRVADGLDRAHSQACTAISVDVDPKRGEVNVRGEFTRDADENLAAANEKADLLSAVVGMAVRVRG